MLNVTDTSMGGGGENETPKRCFSSISKQTEKYGLVAGMEEL